MFLYLGIYAVWAAMAFSISSMRRNKALVVLSGIFLALFIGTRDEVGCDWYGYLVRFERLYPPEFSIGDGFLQGEGGFHLINILAREMDWGFRGVVLVAALIFTTCLVRFSLMAPRPLAILAISFPILVIQLGMSGLRQALATGFLMVSYRSFVEGRRWLTATWILVASQFHSSAIVALPLVFMVGRRVSPRYLLAAVVLLAPVAGFLLGGRLEVYSDRYVEQVYGENTSGGAWLRYAISAIPFAVLAWKRKLVLEAFPRTFSLLWLFAFVTLALPFVGVVSSVALHRVVYYVLPVSLLCLICVADSAFRPSSRRLAWSIPFGMYGAYIVGWFGASRHASYCYVPYESWMI